MRKIFRYLSYASLSAAFMVPALGPAVAQTLDIPVMEHANGDLDTCALGQVWGLEAEGDGFLAVRSGPARDFTELDQLRNGEKVWLFDQQGDWLGIIYGAEEMSCSPIEEDRQVPYPGKKGWVHKDWIEMLAG